MIFVTGANGLVGSFIVRKLLQQNIRPRCLKRKNSDLSLLKDVKENIEWVEGDLLDIPLLETFMNGVDTILHSAAIVSFDPDRFDAMFKVNVEGTANLVNIALKKNIENFLFISSIASLGKNKSDPAIDESAKWEQSKEVSYYAETKYLSELEIWRGSEEGLKTIVVNPSIVLGPGNWLKGSTKLFRYAYNENLFFPPGYINFVDVRDVADLTVELLQKNFSNERFILNGGNTTYENFFNKIAKEWHKKSPSVKANKLTLSIAWRLASFLSFIKGKEPFLTKETANTSKSNIKYENKKIRELLNYKFRDLDETIHWVVNELNLKIPN